MSKREQIRSSVIVGKGGKTGNISIKANNELPREGESEPYSDSCKLVESSVKVGPLGKTGRILIRTIKKEKRGLLFGLISGVLTSLCASAIWAWICSIWATLNR